MSTLPRSLFCTVHNRYSSALQIQPYSGSHKEAAMKFGLMHDFRNPAPWFRPYADLYRLLLDQCVRADELGYDNIWLRGL